jgi:eukaryotic-like serine/threonine-protein kinase
MIGQTLGSYRVIARLGAGGMGTIWLGEHQLLGSRAAIKVLLPEMSEQRRIVQRFFDEARAATRIHDPGIVTVLDFGWHEGHAYLVMEYLVGETVADRLRRIDRFPPLQAVRLIQQCAIAMAAAHARGIVHRDLKPDNIYLVADPAVPGGERIKILDFGIAKLIDDADASHSRTQTGLIMGTPAFMSPEQCRGAGGVDHRTDIYALGCVLFNMLCGRPPFIAGTAGDLIVAHLRQDPPAPSAFEPNLASNVDELVLRCLAKEPSERFQSMTELVRDGAQITGDNVTIQTIPPLRASQPSAPKVTPNAETVATGVATTLHGSAGQASLIETRPWRGGIAIVIALAAVAIVIAIVALRGTERQTATPAEAPPTRAVEAPIDAGIEVVAAPPDAAIASTPPPPRAPVRATTRKPGAPAHAASGSATPAPAKGSQDTTAKPYDPYSDR